MNNYKVEFVQRDTYVIDVEAKDEQEAKKFAWIDWDLSVKNSTIHMHQSRDPEIEIETVYDVTNTDDSFSK